MRLLVLLGEAAGPSIGLRAEDVRHRVADAFASAGAEADVCVVTDRDLVERTRQGMQSDVDAVVAGGMDGTMNAVVNTLAGGYKPLGVLPMGRGGMASPLGLPRDWNSAVTALASAKVVDWPVAEVNGRVFLNYVAIGVDASRLVAGDKFPLRSGTLRLSARGHTMLNHAGALIISNNPHQLRVMGLQSIATPQSGAMGIYVSAKPARPKGALAIVRRMMSARSKASLEMMALPEVRIDARSGRLDACVDGEIITMRTPLRLRVRERPLRMLAPINGDAEGLELLD